MPTPKRTLRGPRPTGGGCPSRAVVFDLLTDDLPVGRASSVRAHLRDCSRCADTLEREKRFKAILDEGLASRRSSVSQETCPDEASLCDYIDGDLEGPARAQVARHVERCARCRDFVALARGQSVYSEFFPSPPREILDAAAIVPQIERQYRQRVDDLNRLFAPRRVFIQAKFNGLPTAAVRGPDEFQRHVTMISTLFAAWARQTSSQPIKTEVLLTTELMEVAVLSVRFEFTPQGVSLYRQSHRVDFAASLEDILSRHLRSSEISHHQSGIRLLGMFLSRAEELPDEVGTLPEELVKLSDLKASIARLKSDPGPARLDTAKLLRKYYSQIVSSISQFDAREIRRSQFAPSVQDALKVFGTFGGAAAS